MSISDKIICMSRARKQQEGSPMQLYKHPANSFVARFVGTPEMSLFEGELDLENNLIYHGQKLIKLNLATRLVEKKPNQEMNSKVEVRESQRQKANKKQTIQVGKINKISDNKSTENLTEINKISQAFPSKVYFGARIEDLKIVSSSIFKGRIVAIEELGRERQLLVAMEGMANPIPLISHQDGQKEGDRVCFLPDFEQLHIFDKESGARLN